MSHLKNPSWVSEKMPEMIVKIVGSKYVRYRVDNSKCCPVVGQENTISHLIEMMRRIPNINSFRGSLLRRDRTLCDLLSVSEFLSVCESHGVSIPPSSLIPLLEDDVFAHQGKIRWRKIFDLLHSTEQSLPQENEATKDLPSYSKDLEIQVSPQQSSLTSECFPVASATVPLQGSRPMSEPALHLFEERSCWEPVAWIDRFKKLENVLWLCQIKDTGLVEKERARQILHRYNVLYGLSLSEEKMAEALEKFGVKDHMTLGPALLFLKDL
ncbi:uncharacterized protein C1orf87 homolog [Rana temporaria]|uniref:uncharacterized protein C1orf87 homolog n=1 Tax=Rana temporaria TaxID=8407 RepID=UPI001AACC223|nr:uncharacterized protein C1orf87 homolog [Rana temporaria]